jgi:hypothetical protein
MWVERSYWMIAIASIPIGTVLGLLELRRIRREQQQKPRLEVGFGPLIEGHELAHSYHVRTLPAPALLELPVVVNNIGSRTARELYFSFVFAPTSSGQFGSPYLDTPTTTTEDKYIVARRLPDGSLFYLIRRIQTVMHPGVYFEDILRIETPPGIAAFAFLAVLRVADIPTTLEDLFVLTGSGENFPVIDELALEITTPPGGGFQL